MELLNKLKELKVEKELPNGYSDAYCVGYLKAINDVINHLTVSNKSNVLQPIIIAEQSEATVCPRCAEFRKTHGKDSECIPCGLKRINNRQTG